MADNILIMKNIFTYCFLAFSLTIFSQVGIGTTTPQGALDIEANNQGIVVPRVALTASNVAAPVVNPQGGALTAGTLVWNTATAGTAPNNVIPGFYFWDGTNWRPLADGGGRDWSINGNAGTVASTNFLGSTDNVGVRIRTNNSDRFEFSNNGRLRSFDNGTAGQPTYSWNGDADTGMWRPAADHLAFSTNATQRMRIGNTGNVGVGVDPSTSIRLDVSSGTNSAVYGRSNNVGGYLGYQNSFSFGVTPQTLNGSGIWANNPNAGYTSVFGQSTGSATVAASVNYSDVWMATYNLVDNASGTTNPSASYNQLNNTNSSLGGNKIALRGYSNRGNTSGNPGYTIGVQGIADAQNEDSFGVQGIAFTNTTTRAGGYFESLTYAGTSMAYAYVGTSAGGVNRKILGTNSVSEIIPTQNHGRVTLTCPESPEYWYQDYGTVEMVNGRATIILDEILADIIVVDEDNPIRVICTPMGMPYFNGVTIMSQTQNSVELWELNGGTHSGKLQYQLVVKPKTNYGEGRFPQAPGPSYLKTDREPLAAKAKNQPNDGRTIFQWPSDHEVYGYNPEDFISIGDIVPAGPNAGKYYLGNGQYSDVLPAENPAKKKKE